MAQWRQAQIAEEVFGGEDVLGYGGRKRLADKHGVSSATITRDLAAIRSRFGYAPCVLCRTPIDMRIWRDLQRRGWVKLQKLPKGRRADEAAGIDRSVLTPELVLEVGGWGGVLAIAEEQREAVILVDYNGNDEDIVLFHWRKVRGRWLEQGTITAGHFEVPEVGFFEPGRLAYAVGRSRLQDVVVVRFRGRDYECPVSEAGAWAFFHSVIEDFDGDLPQVVWD